MSNIFDKKGWLAVDIPLPEKDKYNLKQDMTFYGPAMETALTQNTEEDKKEMLEGLGLDGSGLDKLIKATYDILGLETYFTVGKDEVRAWTYKDGMNAKECAGIIHTDFEKGFIKAEIMSYEDLKIQGNEKAVTP